MNRTVLQLTHRWLLRLPGLVASVLTYMGVGRLRFVFDARLVRCGANKSAVGPKSISGRPRFGEDRRPSRFSSKYRLRIRKHEKQTVALAVGSRLSLLVPACSILIIANSNANSVPLWQREHRDISCRSVTRVSSRQTYRGDASPRSFTAERSAAVDGMMIVFGAS
jgi:hypothetical protein